MIIEGEECRDCESTYVICLLSSVGWISQGSRRCSKAESTLIFAKEIIAFQATSNKNMSIADLSDNEYYVQKW